MSKVYIVISAVSGNLLKVFQYRFDAEEYIKRHVHTTYQVWSVL